MGLNAEHLALLNITFIVPDNELAAEGLLIGLPILQYLTKTMLENPRCSRREVLLLHTKCQVVLRQRTHQLTYFISVEINITQDIQLESEDRTRVNYYEARSEEDLFPDTSLIDCVDIDEQDDVEVGMEKMIMKTSDNGLTQAETKELSHLAYELKNIF